MTARLLRYLGVLAMVVWIIVPVAGVRWLAQQSAITEFAEPRSAEVPIEANTEAMTVSVVIAVTRTPPPTAYAPEWSGTVSRVGVSAGSVISTGTVIATINGVDRIAAVTDEPFWRPLGPDAEGDDVASLNALLGSLGYAHGNGTKFTDGTIRGVEALSVALGSAKSSTFDPAWVIWIATADWPLATLALTPGKPAPAVGETVLVGLAPVSEAVITQDDPGVSAGGSHQTAAESPPAPTEEGSGTEPAAAGSGPAEQSASSPRMPAYSVPAGASVAIDGTQLTVGEDRTRIDVADLSALASLMPPSASSVQAVVTIPPADGQWGLPSGAIFAGATEPTCVLRIRDGQRQGIAVTVVASTYTKTLVDGDLRATDQVVVAVPKSQRSCG